MSSYRYVIGALLLVEQVALGLNWFTVTPLFPLVMDELVLDRATVSLLFSMVPICQGAFAIPAGMMAARFGVNRLFTVGAFAMAAGAFTPLLPEFSGLLFLRSVYGVGTGIFAPLVSAMLVQWFRDNELPAWNGLMFVAGGLGGTIGFFLTVPLTELLGWRQVLMLYGIFAAVGATAWLVLGREGPNQGLIPTAGTQAPRVADVLRDPRTHWLALAFACPIACLDAFIAWLPTYYNRVFGMDLAVAAAITGILSFTGIPASLIGGMLSARLGLRKPFLLVPGGLLAFFGIGCFLVNELWVIVPALVVFGLLMWTFPPILFTIPMELPGLSPALVAVVIGMVLTIAGVTAFFAPLVVGFLADITGSYLPGFFLFTGVCFVLLIAGAKLPETGPRGRVKVA